jgi:hypothetical protein
MPEPKLEDVQDAYPEWQIEIDSAGVWHARLTTSEERHQPELAAPSLAELADALNNYMAGRGQLRGRRARPPDGGRVAP